MNKWNNKFRYQVASCWLFILSYPATVAVFKWQYTIISVGTVWKKIMQWGAVRYHEQTESNRKVNIVAMSKRKEDFVHRTVWHMNDIRRGRRKREIKKNVNSLAQIFPVPNIGLRTSPTRTCLFLHHEPRRFRRSQLPAADSGGCRSFRDIFCARPELLAPTYVFQYLPLGLF